MLAWRFTVTLIPFIRMHTQLKKLTYRFTVILTTFHTHAHTIQSWHVDLRRRESPFTPMHTQFKVGVRDLRWHKLLSHTHTHANFHTHITMFFLLSNTSTVTVTLLSTLSSVFMLAYGSTLTVILPFTLTFSFHVRLQLYSDTLKSFSLYLRWHEHTEH